MEQDKSEAPQQPFIHGPAIDIVEVFQPAIDADENQKQHTKDDKVLKLTERNTENRKFPGPLACADGVIDDDLRQLERHVKHGMRDQRRQHEHDLLSFAVRHDVAIKTALHWRAIPCSRGHE